MLKVLAIGLGGMFGSVIRYVLSGAVQSACDTISFPIGTMVVNISGCLVIGFLAYLAEYREAFGETARLFLIVGVLGGYTTFSAFGNETFHLLREGEAWLATLNVAGQVILGLAAVWLGSTIAYWIWR